jgi:hypothetical protein
VTAARVALLKTVRDGDHLGVVRRIEPAGGPARFDADASGTTTTASCVPVVRRRR